MLSDDRTTGLGNLKVCCGVASACTNHVDGSSLTSTERRVAVHSYNVISLVWLSFVVNSVESS